MPDPLSDACVQRPVGPVAGIAGQLDPSDQEPVVQAAVPQFQLVLYLPHLSVLLVERPVQLDPFDP